MGAVVEGPVTSLTKFGAFVQLAEGVEGMIHVGDISAEKRINHPQDVLKVGQMVKAQVLEVDTDKRRLRLGMKQLVPTSLDEYIAEHKEGDVVTGRMTEVSGGRARVELGEGIQAICRLSARSAREGREAGRAEGRPLVADLHAGSQVEGRPGDRRTQARAGARRPDPQLPHRQAGRRRPRRSSWNWRSRRTDGESRPADWTRRLKRRQTCCSMRLVSGSAAAWPAEARSGFRSRAASAARGRYAGNRASSAP